MEHPFCGAVRVGKSSLINHILPTVNAQVGGISETSGLGQHTTTSSRLYHLPQGGNLIDSPGFVSLGYGIWSPIKSPKVIVSFNMS